MNMSRQALALSVAALLLLGSGCAVTRGQETVGAYLDDTGITTQIKSRFVESKQVDANAISVETLNGTVMLSGFAKSQNERSSAETIARAISGVKAVKNEIAVRPGTPG
jgi:hyperosmotically inducible protein